MATDKIIDEGYLSADRRQSIHEVPLDATPKSRWERTWPVFACGAGLFSDGYLNGVYVELSILPLSRILTIERAGPCAHFYSSSD